MLGGVMGAIPYFSDYSYNVPVRRQQGQEGQERTQQAQAAESPRQAQSVGTTGSVAAARGSNPDVPVEAVRPVPLIHGDVASEVIPYVRKGADPAEMAVRMRMRPYDDAKQQIVQDGQGSKAQDVREMGKEEECQTCARRKYQDGSDDPGVSFKTAAHIAPEQAAATVRGHEMEHVVREQAKAVREDRRVVSQSVTLHTSICPECGDAYVSGGTTRTVTAAKSQPVQETGEQRRRSFFAIA